MRMDELVGKQFDFYGVDNNCFKLDDTVYEVVEDESDGYRSMMDEVKLRDSDEVLIFFRTPVARVTVTEPLEYGNYGTPYPFEGYALIDESGHTWLTFGTENWDDYYPCFIFAYAPKETPND